MKKTTSRAISRELVFILLTIYLFPLAAATVASHGEEFDEAQRIIDSNKSCRELTDEQLEVIGDYYMEQIHPGEAHETMDNMIGGEGSDSLKQMHIMMARKVYCNEGGIGMMSGNASNMKSSGGMMNMMPMNMMPMMMNMIRGGNMMGSGGMMGGNAGSMMGTTTGYWPWYGSILNLIWLVFWLAVLVVASWLIYSLIMKKNNERDPLIILKRRLASGEITKKQFEDMKKDIETG